MEQGAAVFPKNLFHLDRIQVQFICFCTFEEIPSPILLESMQH